MSFFMMDKEFKDMVYEGLSKMLKAIANANRIEVIEILSQGEKSVEGIVRATGMTIANASQHLQVLKNNNIVKTRKDGHFVYYSLKLELKRLKEKAQGSQTKFLTMPILNNIVLRNISKNNQQQIASVLSNLDSKIAINNRINTELEAMAKTLYDYWFVQFDFPNAEGKPYKSSGGKMVWNEELKREVPEGWKIEKMSEWVDIDKSGDWGKGEMEGNFTKK